LYLNNIFENYGFLELNKIMILLQVWYRKIMV
jgi:hypothetical protein